MVCLRAKVCVHIYIYMDVYKFEIFLFFSPTSLSPKLLTVCLLLPLILCFLTFFFNSVLPHPQEKI